MSGDIKPEPLNYYLHCGPLRGLLTSTVRFERKREHDAGQGPPKFVRVSQRRHHVVFTVFQRRLVARHEKPNR